MQIESLTFTNFRAFEQATFEFQPGMNLLVGINGVGKSSVLDALRISLSRVLPQFTACQDKWMDTYGSLHTFRHGFKYYGRTLRIAYFKDAHGLNSELESRYAANCVGITRQLEYSEREKKRSLDITLRGCLISFHP